MSECQFHSFPLLSFLSLHLVGDQIQVIRLEVDAFSPWAIPLVPGFIVDVSNFDNTGLIG